MDTTTELKAGRREWIGLAVLALPTLLLSLDMSVLYLALPQISADLQPSSAQQLWMMDIYGFMIAGFLITMGTLGDRIGRRRLLMFGAGAFALASVVAAYSASAEMLIATRALMGIAGATLMPSTLALIRNMFVDEHQRGLAIGVWMSCFMGGMTVGPLVGGVLLENFWWGSAFLLGVPVMVLLLVTAPALLPEYRDKSAGRIDLVSVSLSLAAILPVIYGLKEVATDGVTSTAVLTVVAGMAFGTAFVRRQMRLADPLMDLSLFRRRAFSVTLSMNFFGALMMGGTFLLATLYLQLVKGLSPLEAGLWLVPINIAMAATSMYAPQLVRRFATTSVMATGLAITAAGYLLLAQVEASSSLALLIVSFTVASVGIALPSAIAINIIIGSVPPEKAGSAASISETSSELGIALGIATIGSVGTAIYRSQVEVPAGVAGAEAARSSLEGALATAAQLPGSVGTQLIDSARDAFTSGLNTAAGIGVVVFVVLTVLVWATLRDTSATVDQQAHTEEDLVAEPR